jgi:hypothetical protein
VQPTGAILRPMGVRSKLTLSLVAITISGCAGSSGSAPPTSSNQDTSPVGSTPRSSTIASADSLVPVGVVGASLSALPTAKSVPATQSAGLVSMPWRLADAASKSSSLNVAWVTGDGYCLTPRGFTVTESPTKVTLTAWSAARPGQTACPDNARLATDVVQLSAPLGSRQLIHGPVDSQEVATGRLLG